MLQIEQVHTRAQEGEILIGDGGDGNVVDIHLILANEIEEQIEGPLENTKADPVRIGCYVGLVAWFDWWLISQGRGMASSVGRLRR